MVLLVALLWWAANGASRADRRVRAISRVPEENPSPVIRLTPDGEILYANPASAELVTALRSSPDGAVAARVTAAARDAYDADEQRNVEFSFEGCTYLSVFSPVRDEGHVNLYASDITARIAAEETVAAQAREQSVLYHLTDSVHRADTIDEIYEAAMTAILQGAQCDRAAILLFDGEGSMSFVASRGLSENYRSAVVGHSPWEPGDRNSVPITIADITRAEITEELRRAIMSEGICALGFIPLQSSAGDVIGKFMIYYDEIHEWTDAELEFASTIARQIAFGLERKVTEQALRDNEERLRLATQTGKVGIWDWDITADRVAWTESLYAMHGLEPGGFDGTSAGFAGLLHPDDAARVDSALKAALAGEQNYELEFRIIKPDGAVGWLFTNATIVGDGEHRRMVGATVDITELKQAELATERLAAIVESSQDAIIGLDLQGTITSWNKGAESVFKYTAVEAIGRSVLMLLPEERWPEEIEILDRIRRGDVIEHYETIRLRKDGQPLEISLSISPLRNSSGEVIGASKIGRDITHRKRAETAIRARETLQRIVEAQEAERSRIARDLHDHLGQQLTGLRLKLESMKPTMTGDASASNSIEQACRQAKQIDSDLSLLAWELRPVSSESHGLHEVLGSFVRDWGQSHGIRAEFQCVSRNGRLEAEVENNLYRIAQEALNNILKHAAATEVSVTLNQNGRETVLVVEDNGRGFDHEKTAASSAGGLGLVGMRERAALLGGRLEIESTAGGGTAIYARVPTHPTPKAATGLN
jgi:PAS domain S-box-containing protein